MSDFDKAIAFVLASEGGYVNDPEDPGGATNMGITQRTLDGWRDRVSSARSDVRGLTAGEAGEIYRALYWNRITDGLAWPLNLVVFDAAVNHGPSVARKIAEASADLGADAALAIRRYLYARMNNPRFIKGWMNRLDALRRLYT